LVVIIALVSVVVIALLIGIFVFMVKQSK
jgi:uncharacterized membrane protein YraQ (UPF0718 family)